MFDKERYQRLTARQWWEEYVGAAEKYAKMWPKMFGGQMPRVQKSWWRMLRRGSKNFVRIPGDFIRLARTAYRNQKTAEVVAELTVEDRGVVLRDFERGMVKGKNIRVYEALAREEVATEVNCRSILRIRGMNLGQFYKLLSAMGANIHPFFSEDKGENAGRWARDNSDLHEFLEIGMDRHRDAYYLRKMFPKVSERFPWGRWTNSRTHGVIFEVETEEGEKELLAAVHVDAENALVAIKEILTGKKQRRISALEYHRMPEQQGSVYVGSGMSEWGCMSLIGLVKKAFEKGMLAGVKVSGEEKLATWGTIAEDDKLMWEVYYLARSEFGRIGKI